MKNKVKFIWGISCYPLMYIVLQAVISVICSFVMAIAVNVRNADKVAGMTPEEISELILDNFNIQIPLLINAIVVFVIMYILLRKDWKHTSFWKADNLNAVIILLCFVSGIGLNLFTVGALNLVQLTNLFPQYEELISSIIGNNFILEVICIGALVPFIEEVIFRGVVFGRLRKVTSLPAALCLQAALFGLIHFNILQSSYAFIFGIALGLAYIWINSIWAVIALHMAYNLTSLLISYFIHNLTGGGDIPTPGLIAMTVAGLAVSAVCLTFFAKRAKSNARA